MKAVNPNDPNGEPLEVKFGIGGVYTYWCTECDYENGAFIDDPSLPRGTREKQAKSKYSPLNRPCVQCGGGPVKWKKVGEIKDDNL